jgi:hypothetical protein
MQLSACTNERSVSFLLISQLYSLYSVQTFKIIQPMQTSGFISVQLVSINATLLIILHKKKA